MAHVQTILGRIHPDELGLTSVHEHLVWRSSASAARGQPGIRQVETAQNQLVDYRLEGGRSVVAIDRADPERDLDLWLLLSRASAVHVIASTPALASGESVEAAVARIEKEFDTGIQGSGVRPGMITLDVDGPTDPAAALRAGGLASQATGSAVTVLGFERGMGAELLTNSPLIPSRSVIAHRDWFVDPHVDLSLAAAGFFLSFDRLGVDPVWHPASPTSDEQRIRAIADLVRAGHGERIVLSADANCSDIDAEQAPLNSLGGMMRRFLPALEMAGLGHDLADQVLRRNPARLLSRP